mgnify:CR=1 FL=1
MLRSLVGSEMCIRDSPYAVHKLVLPAVRARGDGLVLPVDQHRLDAGAACLLYTSDAADDLLCVDLGGRRIIKKKNKTYQHILTVNITI